MNDRSFVISILKSYAKEKAQKLQTDAENLTPTELISQEDFIPIFDPSRQYLNFKAGYICKSPTGNVVKLIQPYDSTIYSASPEELPAQWGFFWTTDPNRAKPFVSIATSPYNKDDVCLFEEHVWRSKIDHNVHSPKDYLAGWDDLGSTDLFHILS